MDVDFREATPKRQRFIVNRLLTALAAMPVVFLTGPRQAGKTTLVRHLLHEQKERTYYTLDDALYYEAARSDPSGFIEGLRLPATIDEVQRVPALFLAVKARVDRERVNGDFLLTGSSNIMLTSRVADSLAGRMATIPCWPFAQTEIEGGQGSFIDSVYADTFFPQYAPANTHNLCERIIRGGYPLAQCAEPPLTGLHEFIGGLVTSLLQRDIRDLVSMNDTFEIQRILRLLSARPAAELNATRLASDLALPRTTVQGYLRLLELAFLTFSLLPWSSNHTSRLVKTPKVYFADTAIACYEAGINRERLQNDTLLLGHLLENFVVSEILKMASWHSSRVDLFHYRTHAGKEVDLVMERWDRRIVGVEIKASRSVTRDDLRGLNDLREAVGDRFARGILLHQGDQLLTLDGHTIAPVSVLWLP
jgi:uncharacterized protein